MAPPHRHVDSAGRGPKASRFPAGITRRRQHRRVIRAISARERVHINVPNDNYERHRSREFLRRHACRRLASTSITSRPTNAGCRDHGPRSCCAGGAAATEAAIVDWGYNAWGGKYPPYDADDAVPTRVAEALGLPVFYPGIVMEGGAVDFNGAGTVLTTTSCLLNKNRNPRLSQAADRAVPARLLRAAPHRLARPGDRRRRHRRAHRRPRALHRRPHDRHRHRGGSTDANYRVLHDNRASSSPRLRDQDGRPFHIVEICRCRSRSSTTASACRRPTSTSISSTARCSSRPSASAQHDRQALAILQDHLPRHKVIGVDCRALIWGLGAIHCLTQQQPKY